MKSLIYGLVIVLIISVRPVMAQTLTDGIYMGKNQLCGGVGYSYDSWKFYWEGTFRRENFNIGTVSTQMVMPMAAYGISKKLNVLAMLPYVRTHATAGTLRGMQGFQDATVGLKFRPISLRPASGLAFDWSVVGAASIPTTNYVADFLPLSIGLQSKTAQLRTILHLRLKQGWFVTGQAGYIARSNVKIDRESYYTDRQHRTNVVDMPNVADYTARLGYMKSEFILEGFVEKMTTLGGTDIRKNDMPFLSNRMNFTKVGAMVTLRPRSWKGLGLTASAGTTLAGRNVGESTTFGGSIVYLTHHAIRP
jgi:hypothetical protein